MLFPAPPRRTLLRPIIIKVVCHPFFFLGHIGIVSRLSRLFQSVNSLISACPFILCTADLRQLRLDSSPLFLAPRLTLDPRCLYSPFCGSHRLLSSADYLSGLSPLVSRPCLAGGGCLDVIGGIADDTSGPIALIFRTTSSSSAFSCVFSSTSFAF